MRPGLVAVGVVLLVLGAISVVLVLPSFVSSINAPKTQTSHTSIALLSGSSQLLPLNGTDTSDGTFTLSWTATASLNVTLYERGSCSPSDLPCILGNVAAHWPSNATGSWSTSGTLAFPYILQLANPTAEVATASPNWSVSVNTLPYSVLTATVLLLTGMILAVIGALALYLGLFLRGGVYGPHPPRPPVVSQSADDVDELDKEWTEDVPDDDEPFEEQ